MAGNVAQECTSWEQILRFVHPNSVNDTRPSLKSPLGEIEMPPAGGTDIGFHAQVSRLMLATGKRPSTPSARRWSPCQHHSRRNCLPAAGRRNKTAGDPSAPRDDRSPRPVGATGGCGGLSSAGFPAGATRRRVLPPAPALDREARNLGVALCRCPAGSSAFGTDPSKTTKGTPCKCPNHPCEALGRTLVFGSGTFSGPAWARTA